MEAWSNASQQEVCKGSGTDNDESAPDSGRPFPDSSQIFPRAEKRAICSGNNED